MRKQGASTDGDFSVSCFATIPVPLSWAQTGLDVFLESLFNT
jgi:hypothetical protein